ncbi:MAG: nucleotidyltransferase family protein [Planctomycetes bacterium]|nr:nucleotidyltransferase family protein [Planctomycetota bacterium]
MQVIVARLDCERCGHSWVPRRSEVRLCPSCKSAWFDKPFRKKTGRIVLNRCISLLRSSKKELFDRYGVRQIFIFGSYARGDQTNESDLDIMVDLVNPLGLKFFELQRFLELILGVRVDLVIKGSIKPNRFSYIEKDLVHV